MPLLILAVLIAIPLIEVGIFIEVGDAIGLWPTIGLIILTTVVGIWIVRVQGFFTLMQARAQLAQGEVPTREIFDGICLAFAGMLLLLPGFATDALGLLLLLPPTRSFLFGRSRVRAERMQGGFHSRTTRTSARNPDGSSTTIEGEWQEVGNHEELPPGHRRPDQEPPEEPR